jgi:hypothetical protein
VSFLLEQAGGISLTCCLGNLLILNQLLAGGKTWLSDLLFPPAEVKQIYL